MKTKFIKLKPISTIEQWILFRTAGSAWMETLNLLENNKHEIPWTMFYVKPWVVSFCIELFIKSIAAHQDKMFNGKKYSHNVTGIIGDYEKSIPTFHKILNDKKLFNLITEYEKTIDTKFGETSINIDGDEQVKLIRLIYDLEKEVIKYN